MEEPTLDEFAVQLMDHFLANFKSSKVVIRCFRNIPDLVREHLFGSHGLSFDPFVKLLPRVTDVTFTDIDIEDLRKNGKIYMHYVEEWAGSKSDNVLNITNIEFRSMRCQDVRDDPNIEA